MLCSLTGLAVGLGVSGSSSNGRGSHSTSPSPTPSPSPTVCTTESCVKLAGLVLQNLNQTVDPCDDFYNFTCGGWEATHTVSQGPLHTFCPNSPHLIYNNSYYSELSIGTLFLDISSNGMHSIYIYIYYRQTNNIESR